MPKAFYKESWVSKNWCFWTVVLEKTLESPLDCKEIQPVHLKGNQSWIFIGRTDVEAKTPILWPPDAKNWLTGKDPDARRDWGQEKKGMTEDEMVAWDTNSMDMSLSKLWELVMHKEAWRAAVHGVTDRHDWVTELNWQSQCQRTLHHHFGCSLQASILEWVAAPFSRWSSQPRYRSQVCHIAGGCTATHCSGLQAGQSTPVFLPGESPWTAELGGLQSKGSQRLGHDWETKHSTWSQ